PAPGLVRDPGPAVVGVDPVPLGIGPPADRHPSWLPHPSVAGALEPAAIGGELAVKDALVDRSLIVRLIVVGCLVRIVLIVIRLIFIASIRRRLIVGLLIRIPLVRWIRLSGRG